MNHDESDRRADEPGQQIPGDTNDRRLSVKIAGHAKKLHPLNSDLQNPV
jgi:hypothetical protein